MLLYGATELDIETNYKVFDAVHELLVQPTNYKFDIL